MQPLYGGAPGLHTRLTLGTHPHDVLHIATVHLSGEYFSFTILQLVFVHMVIKPYYAHIMPNYDSIILLT